jgi:tRNA A-37 threonylcarbamoyl transferase component Bud32
MRGQKLNEILQDKDISREKREQVRHLLSELITKLHKEKITHGDLKHNNILITDTAACVTDLDGMKIHRIGWLFKVRQRKDLRSVENITM